MTSDLCSAGPRPVPEFDEKVCKLRDMGFEEHTARSALSSCQWNLEKATETLFS